MTPDERGKPDGRQATGQDGETPRVGAVNWRRLGKWASVLFGGLFAIIAVAVLALGLRLAEGPIRVSFLTSYVQQTTIGLPDDWSITVDDTFIDWSSDSGGLRVRTENIGVINAAKQRVLSIPNAAFTIRIAPLLVGRFEPSRVFAVGISFVLTHDENRTWRLGLATADDSAAAPPLPRRTISELVSDLFGPPVAGGTGGYINSLTLINSRIAIIDRTTGRVYGLDARRLSMTGLVEVISIAAEVEMETRGLKVPLAGEMIFDPQTISIVGDIRFENLNPKSVAEALDGPEILSGLDLPVSGRVNLAASNDEGLDSLSVELTSGAGVLHWPEQLAAPIPVKGLTLDAAIDPAKQTMQIRHLAYDAGDFSAIAQGSASIAAAGPSLDLEIRSDSIPLRRAPDFWPRRRGGKVRRWMLDNVVTGQAREVVAKLAVTPGMWKPEGPPESAFDVRFRFEDTAVRLPTSYGVISKGEGRVALTGRTITATVAQAQFGELALSNAVLSIPRMSAKPATLNAAFDLKGRIADMVATLAHGVVSARNPGIAQLADIGGDVAGRARLAIPLTAKTTRESLSVTADLALSNVNADGLFADMPARAETLTLKLDNEGIDLTGWLESGNSRLSLHWREWFSPDTRHIREVSLKGALDVRNPVLAAYLPAGQAAGRADASGFIRFDAEGGAFGHINADLAGVALNVDRMHWRKSTGDPGNFSLVFRRAPSGSTAITGLKIQGGGLSVLGNINLDAEGRLLDGQLGRVTMAGSTLSLALQRNDANELLAKAAGRRLDLRPWLDDPNRRALDSDLLDGVRFDLALDEMILVDEMVMTAVAGGGRISDSFPHGEITGMFNGKTPLSVALSAAAAGPRITITADDAGTVFDALGWRGAINKGQLYIDGTLTGELAFSGFARIADFRLVDTPVFARLLSLASFIGIAEALTGSGLSFSRAEAVFTYANRRLDIKKGRMAGPSVGLTTEGYLDRDAGRLRFVGNLIPAYSISRILGNIPLLGIILGGEEGLFGVTYTLDGPIDEPVAQANPLSVLAPGILRRMFLAPVEDDEAPASGDDDLIQPVGKP